MVLFPRTAELAGLMLEPMTLRATRVANSKRKSSVCVQLMSFRYVLGEMV